jgi:L-rhamnose mutarotase
MVLEVDDTFTFERKAAMDAANEHVQAWETMMGKLIQAIPSAKPGARWIPMQRVFELSSASAATLPSHSLRV